MEALPFSVVKRIWPKVIVARLQLWRLTMLERRRVSRTKVFKGAKLIPAGRPAISCIVRDLSNLGACLHLSSTADLPTEFDLSFDTGRTLRKCRVAWQSLTNVGVSFERLTPHAEFISSVDGVVT